MGLYFNYDEPFICGLKCKHLFNITTINDYDADDVDNSILMMLGTTQFVLHSCLPMYLVAAVRGTGTHMLVDTGAKHNVIDINFTCPIGLLE